MIRRDSTAFDLELIAQTTPELPAIIDPHGVVSYGDLWNEVPRWLALLAEMGLDLAHPVPVAFVAKPERSSLSLLAALLSSQIPCVPLHPRWQSMDRSTALTGKPRHLTLPDDWSQRLPATASTAALATRTHAKAALTARTHGQIAAIIFTSGSQALPKGVCLTESALVTSASASAANLGWFENDRWLLDLPLAHIGGLSVFTRCLVARKPCVLASPEQRQDLSLLFDWLEASRTTLLSLVPTQLERWLRPPERALPASVRAILVGGAHLPVALERQARSRGWPILPTYGLTEASSQVATRSPKYTADAGSQVATRSPEHAANAGFIGRVLGTFESRIVAGRLELRGPCMFQGYWGEEVRDSNAWFQTSDLASLDADQQLSILGRADDMLITGGENVHPSEVESVLMGLPGVENACVFGRDDAEWGQALACVVSPEVQDLPYLKAQIRSSLAAFKCPKWIATTRELPTTASGKVDRKQTAIQFLGKLRNWD